MNLALTEVRRCAIYPAIVKTACAVGLVSFFVGTVACRGTVADPNGPVRILRLATSNPGASSYRIGAAFARMLRSSNSHIQLQLVDSIGSVQNIKTMDAGDVDIGFAYADVAYLAFSGGMANPPLRHLRGIAVLQSSRIHLIVRKGSTIHSVSDLRGRRVNVGAIGSGSLEMARLVLQAFDVEPHTVTIDTAPARQAAHRLLAGDLDALLILATDPYDPITVAMRGGSQLVPIQGVAVERLRESSPFVNLSSIPDQTYPGQTERVHTISIDTMLLCRSDLDEGIVYEITRAFFKALPSFVQTEDSLRSVVLSRIDATPIPLHPGAQRYYRERELSR